MNASFPVYTSPILHLNQPDVYYNNPDPSDALDRKALSRLELTEEEVKEDAEQLQIVFKVRSHTQRRLRKASELSEEEGDRDETSNRLKEIIAKRKQDAKTQPMHKRIRQEEKENTVNISQLPAPAAVHVTPALPTTLEGDLLLSTRFSQRSVSSGLEDGQLLFPVTSRDVGITLYDSLRREGWRRGAGPITVVRMPDGLTSFDNRRLAVAHTIVKEASHSLSVPVEAYDYKEKAPGQLLDRSKNVVQRFEDPARRITPDTYGEAIALRVAGSAKLNGTTLTDMNRWGFSRLPDVSLGVLGRNPHEIVTDTQSKSSRLRKKSVF